MYTKAQKAKWARDRKARIRAGIHQPRRGDNLRRELGPDNYKTRPREYSSWSSMIQRCTNPAFKDWHLYGGKGIEVCEEWRKSFAAFFAHIGPRPSVLHSIDRWPNMNGNYEPGNVRWATPKEQVLNSANVRWLTLNGESKSLTDWAAQLGLNRSSLSERIEKWGIEKALSTPAVRQRERSSTGEFAKASGY